MSNEYKKSKDVPNEVLAERLYELGQFVTEGPAAVRRNFGMSIPAELDYDADVVLCESSLRLKSLKADNERLRERLEFTSESLGLLVEAFLDRAQKMERDNG